LAIEFVRCGGIKLDPLVTHNLPLSDFMQALDIAYQRRESAIKVSMTP
jgi:threonine dehydrogenase-like Zn-dependent dehydrogenase